jgi:predicted negative regulator of RcsB-dependent stress response
MADYEEMTASKKLAAFIEKNKKAFIAILIVLVCCLIGYIVFASIAKSNKAKNLQTLDEISYEFTSKSNDLEDAEIDARIATALEKAAPLTKKGGVVGARANMFCAELAFTQEKYDDAANYWKAAADKAKKTYLAPIACFNLAVCYENLGNSDAAYENYKLAADNNDFVMRTHAMFSYGRILEAKADYANAAAAYKELNDNLPNDSWAKLAKSRLISLKNEGKIE